MSAASPEPMLGAKTDAEVVALLIVAKALEIFRIEEIGVGIERTQHAGNSAFIDAFVGANRLSEVLFHQFVNFGELFDAGFQILFGSGGGRRDAREAGSKHTAQNGAKNDNKNCE